VKTEELMIAGLKEDIENINKAIKILRYTMEKCAKYQSKKTTQWKNWMFLKTSLQDLPERATYTHRKS